MKKIKVVLATLIMAGLTLTSCSSDDSSGTAASIVGKWNETKTVTKISGSTVTQTYENEEGCDKDFVEFKAGGTLDRVTYFTNASDDCEASSQTGVGYTKTDDVLVINGSIYEGTYEITKLSGSELRVVTEDNTGGTSFTTTIYFKKAAATN